MALFTTPDSPKSKSLPGSSASSSATPHPEFNWTPRFLQRAEQFWSTRRIYTAHRNEHTGSAQMIKIGSKILIGPSVRDPRTVVAERIAETVRPNESANR